MVTTLSTKRDTPPSNPKQLADWLAPRPGETYEVWSRRFDRAEKNLERSEIQAAQARQARRRGAQPKRRAA